MVAIAAVALAACSGEPTVVESVDEADFWLDQAPWFVEDASLRRHALEESLVDPTNGYAQLRLANYGVDGHWDGLPVRNFAVRPVTRSDIGQYEIQPFRATEGDFEPAWDPARFEWNHEALRELGRKAFHSYPLELTNRFAVALQDDASVDEFGLWTNGDEVGGVVRVKLPDGSETFATTCATCHASVVDGALVDGRANAAIDHSAMSRRTAGIPGSDWWPGVVDVTPDEADNPVAITDLRAVRHQSRLHWAATLHNSPAALSVRIETLMITSANEAMRPPREVAVALAYYLWSLGEAGDLPEPTQSAGAAVFVRECGTCHGAQDAVPLAMVGTDEAVGLSSTRGTGAWRVPSLSGVASRSQFMHQGLVRALEDLLDPARLSEVPGHEFGTRLDDDEKADLLDYLRTL